MRPTPSTLALFVGLFAYAPELVATESPPRKYEIFVAADKSKWIQVSQLETIFHSIDDMLQSLSKKQEEDAISIGHVSNNLQTISQRLQGIENQISLLQRTETSNTPRLDRIITDTAQGVFNTDEIMRKLERNAQQMETRLNEIDSSLEKLLNTQDDLRKEIRKLNTAQNTLATSVSDLTENSKTEASRLMQTLNSSQQQLRQEFTTAMHSLSDAKDEDVMKVQDSNGNKRNLKLNQDNTIPSQLLTSISTLNDSYNRLQERTQSVDVSVKECVSATNKIYERIDETNQNTERNIESLTDLVNNMMAGNQETLSHMETKITSNLGKVLDEQSDFKNNCKRLQKREQQLEDVVVTILKKIFNYIENSTDLIRMDLERVINDMQFRRPQRAEEVDDVYKIFGMDNEQKIELATKPAKSSPLGLRYRSTTLIQKSTDDAQPTINPNTENEDGSSEQENSMNTYTRDSAVDDSVTASKRIVRKPGGRRIRVYSMTAEPESADVSSNLEDQ